MSHKRDIGTLADVPPTGHWDIPYRDVPMSHGFRQAGDGARQRGTAITLRRRPNSGQMHSVVEQSGPPRR
jgi:hypothetical protein